MHLLFVDDILIFSDGSRRDLENLCSGLDLFWRETRMQINAKKITITCANLEEDQIRYIANMLPF